MGKLPIGIQSFVSLREDGYMYVDKTEYIEKLLNGGKVYFLSRPRRFGKSLFLSTLKAYFEGKKELFSGLKIAEIEKEKADPWEEYPVIHMSFATGNYTDEGELEAKVNNILVDIAKDHGVEDIRENTNGDRLLDLLKNIKKKTGKGVVVLIDEYDKPLLDNLNFNEKQEDENRRILKGFFGALKDADEYLKFVFITGVTKFSKVSLFSDLNQLDDISLEEKYSGICGITEEELEHVFSAEILALAERRNLSKEECISKLRRKYDGYHFSEGELSVYNPFSLLNCFAKLDFGNYWFATGTPTFLVQSLMKYGISLQDFATGINATADDMSDYRVGSESVIPLFYQAGYLSISGYDGEFREYTLSFPNAEVEYGFMHALLPSINARYIGKTGKFNASTITRYILSGDVDSFCGMLKALLASIPYYEGQDPSNEQQWRNIVFAVFTILGQYVHAEVHSSNGRSDCIVETDSLIYIFEFKYNKTADEALRQINEKGYAAAFTASDKKIIKVGANFSSDAGTLDEWKLEESSE